MTARVILAIFVGGKSSRMGRPKGLLCIPGSEEPIVEALVRRGRELGLSSVLVGDATSYAELARGAPRIDDDPPGAGPLAGLQAAVAYANREGATFLIAAACDMPKVSAEALRQLCDHRSHAPVLAARRSQDAPWEPMLARYDPSQLAPSLAEALRRGDRSFQALFRSIDVEVLPLSAEIQQSLEDWDTPEDLDR